jgi:putative ABC transport system permease protein
MGGRVVVEPTAEFAPRQLSFVDQTLWRDEVIRPLVLFADRTTSQRAQETETHPDTASRGERLLGVLEINDKRALIVGIARATPTFQSQPIIYTTYSRAKTFALTERKMLAFVLVKVKAGLSPQAVARRITHETGLGAHTPEAFKAMTLWYMLKNTSILANFGFVVIVGFGVGAAVTGQIFHNFTLDNL